VFTVVRWTAWYTDRKKQLTVLHETHDEPWPNYEQFFHFQIFSMHPLFQVTYFMEQVQKLPTFIDP